MKTRIVLFGGTFDPVHRGHIVVAGYAVDYLKADKLIFIPAGRSPHKATAPVASDSQRMEMISAAIKDHDKFEVSDCEVTRAAPSYTIDTVRHFRKRYGPDAELCWLVGADAAKDLDKWHEINWLIDQCRFCIMLRAGLGKPDFSHLEAVLGRERVAGLERNLVPVPMVEISSTGVRAALAMGWDVSGMVDPAVLDLIRRNGIYTPRS